MKKNGYTIGELLILMGVVGVASIIFLTKTSYAFKDNTQAAYDNIIDLALKSAKEYGKTSEDLTNEGVDYVTIGELVEKQFMGADNDGNVVDPRDSKENLNGVTIKLKLNENGDIVATVEK